MDKLDKKDMPLYIIILSLILVFPLGVYLIVLKVNNRLVNIKKVSNILKVCGYIGLIFMILYFIFNYSSYVSLIDSHMSLDMYSFNFIYIYIYSLMVIISSLLGGFYLGGICDKLVIYTEFINIRHIKDLSLISDETLEDMDTVKDNVNRLIEKGHVINIRIEDNHIVSTKTVDKNNLVKCRACGNIKKLYSKNTNCDFCLRKMSKKDHL